MGLMILDNPEKRISKDGKMFIEIHKDIGLVYLFDNETKQLKATMELEEFKKLWMFKLEKNKLENF